MDKISCHNSESICFALLRAVPIINLFDRYPIQIHQIELDYLRDLGLSIFTFCQIRQKLIDEGFKGVDRIKVLSKDEWIHLNQNFITD